MFFYLSKIIWLFVNPGNLLLILLCLGVFLIYRHKYRLSRWLLTATALMALTIAILPIGRNLLVVLENRFPIVQVLPDKVDGIIVLGGVVNEDLTEVRGGVVGGEAIERLTFFATISKQFPNSKLVFTGGSGKVFDQDTKEGDLVVPLLKDLGIAIERVVIEKQSRNTFENALFSKRKVQPSDEETWILITSAFHMPRAVGTFRKVDWDVLPFPVDHHVKSEFDFSPTFNLIGGIGPLSLAIHEWLGLLVYWLTGKSTTFFPSPFEH